MPRAKMDPKKKEKVIATLTSRVTDWDDAEEKATEARHRGYATMLKAYNAGLTYDEIADITGLSKIRVSQVLAEQRGANGAR